jgi:hypothetical protein
MNYKKFAKFIIVLGIIILAGGGVYFSVNQPVEFTRSRSQNFMDALNDMGRSLDVMGQNLEREQKRKTAVKIMIAGGIVLFLGIGVFSSGRGKE